MQMKYVMLSCVLVLMMSCSQNTDTTKLAVSQSKAAKVEVRKVVNDSQAEKYRFSGVAMPELSSQLSFSLPGKLAALNYTDGAFVAKDQLLAELENSEYLSSYQIADADYQRVSDNFERLRKVYESGSLPEKDFVDIKLRVIQAKAQRDIALKKFNDTKLTAPFAGKLIKQNIDVGTFLNPGISIYQLVKFDVIHCEISVPENNVPFVGIGSQAEVFVSALKKTYTGRIISISPVADPATHTYKTIVAVRNKDLKILPGMVVTCSIVKGASTVLPSVPITSLVRDSMNDYSIFVYDPKSKQVAQRKVELGDTRENQTSIRSGVSEGDLLVVKGHHSIEDGQEVVATLLNK
jgi:membrane fusion protein, multidrug efflux system